MKMAMATLGDNMIIVQEIGNGFYCVSLCKNRNKGDPETEIIMAEYVSIQIRAQEISSIIKNIKEDYDWYYEKAKHLNQEESYE